MTEYQCIFRELLRHADIYFNPAGQFYNIRFMRLDGKIVSMTINSDKEAYWDCVTEVHSRELEYKRGKKNG